jgi:toxin-antitoxin system PIN domain toxin
VIAVDTNILVYAFREANPFHGRALACLTRLAEGTEAWAVPWPCIHEFLAIVTNPKIPPGAVAPQEAVAAVEAWMESPSLTLLAESGAHWLALKSLIVPGQVQGGMVHDARIAALCLQHGVRELWTADRDFGRFAGFKTVNPLVTG